MKPVEIEFLIRDNTESGIEKVTAGLDAAQVKYNATRNAISELEKELAKLQKQKLSPDIDPSTSTARIDALKKKLSELRSEVESLEKTYPELGRTVNATKLVPPDAQRVGSTYNSLHSSIQQIAREMPTLAMGPQMFFMAVSNNLPIFTDALSRARQEYDALVKTGQKGTPVWKQVLSSVFSWQTAMTTGIMLLTMYGGKMVEWIGSLVKGKDAASETAEVMEDLNKAMDMGDTARQVASFQKLALAYRNLGDDADAKTSFIERYRDEIDKTGISVKNAADADNLFIRNSDAFIESVKMRAMSMAGLKLASEQYEKAMKQEYKDRADLMQHESRLEMLKAKPEDYKESFTVQTSSMGGFTTTVQTRDELIADEEKVIAAIKRRSQEYWDAGNAYAQAADRIDSVREQKLDDAGLDKNEEDDDDTDSGSNPDKSLNISERLAKMEADAQADVSEMTVRAMKEGYEKERKEAELQFTQEKARIQQELKERLALYAELRKAGADVPAGAEERTKALAATQTAKAGMVYNSRLSQIDAQERKDDEERQKKTEEELQKLLGKYRDYEAQRADIKAEGDKDIAALESARTDENSEEIDRAIAVAKQKVQEGIQEINDAEAASMMSDSGFLKRLFGDWSSMSFESVRELTTQARQLRDYLSGESDAAGITFISKEQLELIENSPEQLDKLKKALDRLLDGKSGGGSSKWSRIFKKFEKGLAELKDADSLDEISGAVGKISGAANEAAGELSGLFDALGMDEASDTVEGVQQILGAVTNIGEGFAKGGVIGAAGAALGEFINFAKSSIEAENRRYEAVKEIQNAKIEFQRQYNILLMEQNLLLEEASNIFGERQIMSATNAINVYRQALDDLNASMQYGFGDGSRASTGSGVRSSSISRGSGAAVYDAKTEMDRYAGGLGKATIVTGFEKTGLFGWGKGRDVYSSVLDVYPELIDESGKLNTVMLQSILDTREMSDETRAYLQNLLDLNGVLEDAQESLRNYLQETYGGLGDGLLDSVIASINNGESALEGFAGNIGSTFEELGSQLAYSLFFADEFDKLQSDLENLYGSGKSEEKITEDAMDLLDDFYDGLSDDAESARNWMQAWKEKAAEKGFDIWGDNTASQEGQAAAFTTMTQDQGTKLEGLFTSGQIHWARMDESLEDIGGDMYEGLSHLRNIDSSTSEIRQELVLIRQDISVLKRDGIKVK